MSQQQLIPHLFRTEFRNITAVLCKSLGIAYVAVAEDIAAETFLSALETWPYKGIPENPVAWLHYVAKNKAKNHLRRQQLYRDKLQKELNENLDAITAPVIDLSEKNITDSQLQMLFAICHPAISPEVQVGLALRVLCGFGIEEIASAFLTNKETINKRLYRGREKLRTENVKIELPSNSEMTARLESVLTTLYLLFSEGYYSETNNQVLRESLCLEAMRLCYMLVENAATNQPEVNALLSLMCFHSSRFAARKAANGELVLYADQDESNWNPQLIEKGIFYLHKGAGGSKLSRYHIEAAIAYWHTIKDDTKEKWEKILQLYNQLLALHYSPVAALNRAYAISKARSKEEGIREAEKLQLTNNHYYFTLLGELYTGVDHVKAGENLNNALRMARTESDKQTIRKKITWLAI